MTKVEEGLGNVVRHGNVNVSGGVIPVDVEAEVARTAPVNGESIFGGKGRKKMVGVCFGEVFDAKVVDC